MSLIEFMICELTKESVCSMIPTKSRSFCRQQQARKQCGEGFVAVFNSELGYYHYSQGIVHVSSFGFGGTNAHAIFWGEDRCIEHFILREGLQKIAVAT